jgi:putative inorganic carbon (hco3(-)) transporter
MFPRFFENKLNRIVVIGFTGLILILISAILWLYPPEYAFAFLMLAIVGVFLYVEPFIGLLIYLVLTYLRVQENFPALDALHLTRIIVFGLFIFWFIKKVLMKDWSFTGSKQLNVMLGMVVVMILSLMNSDWFSESVKVLLGFIRTVIMVFLIINVVDSRRKLMWFIGTMLALHTILAFDLVQEYLRFGSQIGEMRLGATLGSTDATVNNGFLGDANDFALALNIIIPLVYFLVYLKNQSKLKFILIPILGINVLGVILTYSRGGFITLATLFFSFAIMSKRKLLTISVFIIILALVVIIVPSDYSARLKTITAYNTDESSQGRLAAWKAGLKMMIAHPLVGTGVGVFSDTYPKYMPEDAVDTHYRVAHNGYIHIAGELGLLGLLLYVSIIYLTIRDNLTLQKTVALADKTIQPLILISKGLVCSVIAYSVGSMFLSVNYYDHLYLLAALTIAVKQIAAKEQNLILDVANPQPEII